MTAGQKLFELNGRMEDVVSYAAAVQAKIDAGDKHLAVKTVVAVLGFIGEIVSLTFALAGGPASVYWAILGFALLVGGCIAFAVAATLPLKYSFVSRELSERFEAAQTEYRRVLEDEAEAHGIDPGTVKSRKRKNEENTSFLANRNGLPVNLTVEKRDGTMVIKENGRLLSEVQPA
jgi:hypothetical protein